MKYRFIEKHQLTYPIERLCQALEVSRSGYYAWQVRQQQPQSNAEQDLIRDIRAIHRMSRRTYGSPRISYELRLQGKVCNHKRVARLMRLAGVHGARKRLKASATNSKHNYPIAPNLMNQQFEAEAPNTKWVADITYIPTHEGWLYLAAVMDLYSRKIVGWSMADQVSADLVEDALQRAIFERQPGPGLLHHSDRGSQYASNQIRQILQANHIEVSMSRTGNCYDNAPIESFFSTLKCEWVHLQNYRTKSQAKQDIFEYIAGFYNSHRRHSALGYLTPMEFEQNVRKVS
ncbi:MAG: IS3 family transposase [Bellilinea sp.]